MKYRQITNNLQATSNFLEEFLKERHIENLDLFLRPNKEQLCDYLLLDNIVSAAKCVIKHIEECDSIFIIPDCDVDGFTSAAMTYLYLKQVNPALSIDWKVHSGKQHGIVDLLDYIINLPNKPDLVIAPDASSNEEELHQQLKEYGIDVVVLDHHEADNGYSDSAIVVNNQLSENYPNKSLCGAGVVYKFLCCMDDLLGVSYADNFLDLAAVGEIGDMMELVNLETRYIVNSGLNSINNLGLTAFFDKQAYSMNNKINPTTVAFYIVPLFNAVIRVGTEEEKDILFSSLINPMQKVPSTKRGHKPGDSEILCQQAARIAGNAKARQQRQRDKAFESLDFKIQKMALDTHKIIFVKVEDDEQFDNTLTGLIAMQIASQYKKPTIIVREGNDGFLKGSARGLNNCPIEDFRQFCLDSKLLDYAMGHANAFGISLHKNYLDSFLEYADKELADVDFNENVYDVDLIIDSTNPYLVDIITNLGELEEIWGQGNLEPLIAIENIHLSNKEVEAIGADESTVKFTVNGVTYIKFKDKELINILQSYGTMNITVLGKANLNKWMGNITPQIIIENYEVRDTTYSF